MPARVIMGEGGAGLEAEGPAQGRRRTGGREVSSTSSSPHLPSPGTCSPGEASLPGC